MLVVSSPVPPVPDIYYPNYLPQFMVVIYMEKDYIFHLGHKVDGLIDKKVVKFVLLDPISILAGLAILFVLVLAVSFVTTQPLLCNHHIYKQIVESIGKDMDGSIGFGGAKKQSVSTFWFNPYRELNNLVGRFRKMIKKLCRVGGHSKDLKIVLSQRSMCFSYLDEFEKLYFIRRDPGFRFGFVDRPIVRKCSTLDIPCRCHFSPDQQASGGKSHASAEAPDFVESKQVYYSPLFGDFSENC